MNGDFSAVNDSLWFGTAQGRIYYTYNKGASLAVTATPLGDTCEVNTVFRNGSVGMAYGINSSTYAFEGTCKTTNGGTSYTKITPSGYYVKSPDPWLIYQALLHHTLMFSRRLGTWFGFKR